MPIKLLIGKNYNIEISAARYWAKEMNLVTFIDKLVGVVDQFAID